MRDDTSSTSTSGEGAPPDEDPMVQQTYSIAPNLEPVIVHRDQAGEAARKLAALESKTKKRPNILLFMMDDVGWGDLGCYGGGLMTGAPTPNMDRCAREGLLLTSCYSQPSCSPTRATVLTGRLPVRHGILRPPMYGEPGGLEGEITVAEILHEAGYDTQMVGKWHCGENTASQPHNVGFDREQPGAHRVGEGLPVRSALGPGEEGRGDRGHRGGDHRRLP
jgi:arylsulfatase